MLCDVCKKNEATTYFQQTINGNTVSQHLCSECASKVGVNSIFSNSTLNVDQFFTNLLGSTFKQTLPNEQKTCPNCQATLAQISKAGKVGCSTCYETFYEELIPSIEKIHGRATHIGKVSHVASAKLKRKYKLTQMEKSLNEAIDNQEFEKAARLRDEIKAFKEGDEVNDEYK